jgi:hypothetical protein
MSFAVVLAIFGTVSSKGQAKSICDDAKIVPGTALGLLKLGMSIDEAQQLVGKPDLEEQTGKFGGSEWKKLYYYPGSDFYVIAQDGKIVELALGAGTQDTQSCSTSEGIRIGSRKVKKAYGEPDEKPERGASVSDWTYNKKGISAIVNSQGEVLGIEVFVPGSYGTVRDRKAALHW